MAHPDLDQLVNFCLQFSRHQLKRRGRFHPFAATLKTGGTISPLAAHTNDENPSGDALIHDLANVIRSLTASGDADAVAICYDGRVLEAGIQKAKRDAITVALEHRNGESVSVYLPYAKKLFGYRYEPMIAAAKERRFFD